MIVKPEEWLKKPDENGNGLLQAWVVSNDVEYPIPIETHNVSINDVTIGENQEFEFIFECTDKPDVYANEEEFFKSKEHYSMAAESVIPSGLFSPSNDPDFVKNPRIILNGEVVKTYDNPVAYGFDEGDILLTLTCLGNEYDVVLYQEMAEGLKIHEGNIVSGVLWVQGWPAENNK